MMGENKVRFSEQKRVERKSKVKNALIKSFSRAAICFSICVLFMGACCAYSSAWIPGIVIVKIWVAFLIIGFIAFFRNLLDYSNWAMNKPFIVKNLIFMPLCLIVALILAVDILKEANVEPTVSVLLIYSGLFLITFSIKQFISYFRLKAKTDLMNDALMEFQKEHEWDEEE